MSNQRHSLTDGGCNLIVSQQGETGMNRYREHFLAATQDNPAREARRFRALALKEEGWKQAKIAEELGVTPGAVSQWLKRAREQGRDALQTRKGGGPKPRLQDDQIE